MNILVVEDDPRIGDVLVYALRNEGHSVRIVSRGNEALEHAAQVDFVVLDVGLPDIDGFEVCRRIRQTSAVPILFLTSRGDEINRVVGLEIGGDDYMVKPFSPRELVARIKAIHRRHQPAVTVDAAAVLCHGPVRLDAGRFAVSLDGADVALTRQEFRLLEWLMRHPGRVFSREQLLDHVWQDGGAVTDRTVDAHIKTLRRKLDDYEGIETVRGVGYRMKS